MRPDLIDVPGGTVTLSDRRTQRTWTVAVEPFRLAAVPVTSAWFHGDTSQRPVDSVSWWDAVRFCNRASRNEGLAPAYHLADGHVERAPDADGYRLPTEAEWEYACRAGTDGPRYGPLAEIGWYRENSGERSHDVATRRANPWGFFDLLGNVWEWCWDVYDPEVYGEYRVLRGGGWFDEHWSCRASVRRRSHPDLTLDDVGFRVARPAA